MGARTERKLGWVTSDQQRFANRQQVDAGMCPVCGSGPFTVVAAHAAKKHGIDRFAFRELIGATRNESICDPTHSALCRERELREMKRDPDRFVAMRGQETRGPIRLSDEGRRRLVANVMSYVESLEPAEAHAQRVRAGYASAAKRWGYVAP